MVLKYVDEADLDGKSVVARFDFNVPLDDAGNVRDTTRIDSALPTIKYILEKGAKKIVLMSHLGRPKGEFNKKYSLEPVGKVLAEKLDTEVFLTESCLDSGIKTLIDVSKPKIILLQNLRFHREETNNDEEFAKKLASYGSVYVNDAFGTCHRKHASTYGIIKFMKGNAYGGFLLKKEIEALSKITDSPKHPFVAILGGAKVSDKIKVISALLTEVDKMIIGGAMAYPFLAARGLSVGKSLCAEEDVKLAKEILSIPSSSKLVLPVDHKVADSLEGNPETVDTISDDKMGLDVGPKSLSLFQDTVKHANTVVWNGPLGLFENANFSKGTFGMAEILSKLSAFVLVGGGDSVSAIKKSGLADKISHISTGGGASLEFIENKGKLPGIDALRFGV